MTSRTMDELRSASEHLAYEVTMFSATAERLAAGLPEGVERFALAGLSGREISLKLGRSKQAISRVLSAPEMEPARAAARSILGENAAEIAHDFVIASRVSL